MSCVRYVNQSTQCQLLYMEMRYTAYWGCSFTHQIVFIIIWPSKNSPTHIPWLSSCSDQLPTFLNTKHAKRHSVYLSNKFTCFLKRLDFWSTAYRFANFIEANTILVTFVGTPIPASPFLQCWFPQLLVVARKILTQHWIGGRGMWYCGISYDLVTRWFWPFAKCSN